jgi:hypothetical protein
MARDYYADAEKVVTCKIMRWASRRNITCATLRLHKKHQFVLVARSDIEVDMDKGDYPPLTVTSSSILSPIPSSAISPLACSLTVCVSEN